LTAGIDIDAIPTSSGRFAHHAFLARTNVEPLVAGEATLKVALFIPRLIDAFHSKVGIATLQLPEHFGRDDCPLDQGDDAMRRSLAPSFGPTCRRRLRDAAPTRCRRLHAERRSH